MKLLEIRIQQLLVLAQASPCPRRQLAAVLVDPVRNVVLMDGFNGAPRKGGKLCGGAVCHRDGAPTDMLRYRLQFVHGRTPHQQVVVVLSEDGQSWSPISAPVDGSFIQLRGALATPKVHPNDAALDYVEEVAKRYIAAHPPVPSGVRAEVGCHHAESNVICNAAANGVATSGMWLIVLAEPCLMCARLIHHSGIAKVMCVKGGYIGGDGGVEYLRTHGVLVEYVAGPSDPRADGG